MNARSGRSRGSNLPVATPSSSTRSRAGAGAPGACAPEPAKSRSPCNRRRTGGGSPQAGRGAPARAWIRRSSLSSAGSGASAMSAMRVSRLLSQRPATASTRAAFEGKVAVDVGVGRRRLGDADHRHGLRAEALEVIGRDGEEAGIREISAAFGRKPTAAGLMSPRAPSSPAPWSSAVR